MLFKFSSKERFILTALVLDIYDNGECVEVVKKVYNLCDEQVKYEGERLIKKINGEKLREEDKNCRQRS